MNSLPQPQYTLLEATIDDIPAMIPVYHSAFAHDLLSNFTFPRNQITPEEWTRWLTMRFTTLALRPETRHFKIVDQTGELVAFCRWSFPYRLSVEEKAKREEEKRAKEARDREEGRDTAWPIGANRECCDEKFGSMSRAFETLVHDPEDVYGLYFLYL
jgi:hypothetical protein